MIFKKPPGNHNRTEKKAQANRDGSAKDQGAPRIPKPGKEYYKFKISRILQHNNADKFISIAVTLLFFSVPLDLLADQLPIQNLPVADTTIGLGIMAAVFFALAMELPIKAVEGITGIISLQTKYPVKKYLAYGLPAAAVVIALIEIFSRVKITSAKSAFFLITIIGIGVASFILKVKKQLKPHGGQAETKREGSTLPDPLNSFYSMLIGIIGLMFLTARMTPLVALGGKDPFMILTCSLLLLGLAKINLDKIFKMNLVYCLRCKGFLLTDKKEIFRCGCEMRISKTLS